MTKTLAEFTDEQLEANHASFQDTLNDLEYVADDNRFVTFLLNHGTIRRTVSKLSAAAAILLLATLACTVLAFGAALIVPGYWGIFGVALTLSLVGIFFTVVWLKPIVAISAKAQIILTETEMRRRGEQA